MVSRIRSPSLLWAIGSERFSQKHQEKNLHLIWCSQSCLRNKSCSWTLGQEIILLRSFFRKISGLKLALTAQPGYWLRSCRRWRTMLEEIHWLCDGLSLNPSGAFEERHPKIVVCSRFLSIRKKPKISWFYADFPLLLKAVSNRNPRLFMVNCP